MAFLICFATGLYSHFLQDPLPWMVFPTRPVWIYQLTQGIHITAGIACFPLLFAKLFTVFPELFQSPPVRSFAHLLERASIALFVAASLMQITIGLLNTYQLYALFGFSFRLTHYALSWIVIGSLAIHIGVKLPIIARYWRKRDAYDADGSLVAHDADPDAELDVPDELQRLTGRTQTHGVTGRLFAWMDRTPAPRDARRRPATLDEASWPRSRRDHGRSSRRPPGSRSGSSTRSTSSRRASAASAPRRSRSIAPRRPPACSRPRQHPSGRSRS